MTYQEKIASLLAEPENLLKKKPFIRGAELGSGETCGKGNVQLNDTITVGLPKLTYHVISQAQYLKELDPECHKILYDTNVPSITMKIKDRFVEIEYKKMAVPFQQMIKNKHLLHMCGNKMQFTLTDTEPTEVQKKDFILFKQYWDMRNQDGMRTKMVDAQLSMGDAGLLFYYDRYGQIKSRLLCYRDGYVLCPHNDENGDRILESVYYCSEGVEYIDSYDDTYMYRYKKDPTKALTFQQLEETRGWVLEEPVKHGFSEIPLITKRGDVAWDKVQNIIEVYEVIYNIFLVIQKRHGWGILYVKGKFSESGKQIAGAIVLNDTSIDGNGSADFKTPPSPEGMLNTLQLMEETIQKGSGTTFILPKDISIAGDITGVAIQLTQSLDNEKALQGVIEWQNVADKMTRLFKEGLAKELVNKGIKDDAVTSFANLNISAKFVPWRPMNDTEYNSMLIQLKGAGLISEKTGIEKNTISAPDELSRRELEIEEEERKLIEEAERQAKIAASQNTGEKNEDDNK